MKNYLEDVFTILHSEKDPSFTILTVYLKSFKKLFRIIFPNGMNRLHFSVKCPIQIYTLRPKARQFCAPIMNDG